ncbi:hypothetical protein HPG69_017628 [Diceros bicornis minor]|uniref:Spermatogenesis- and oogenesis-specific basic helix-loop-helix-containing protein 2 n=1 Tax=Diceros bicornis minor TaxID=77932 RepID=A0A7J7EL87_DICBM|nr:hypothetical protein HPG69_017628 [Diceros bicornis minor]
MAASIMGHERGQISGQVRGGGRGRGGSCVDSRARALGAGGPPGPAQLGAGISRSGDNPGGRRQGGPLLGRERALGRASGRGSEDGFRGCPGCRSWSPSLGPCPPRGWGPGRITPGKEAEGGKWTELIRKKIRRQIEVRSAEALLTLNSPDFLHITCSFQQPLRNQVEGERSPTAKIDLLLVGDVTVQYLADVVQKFFSNTGEVTVTTSDVKKAAALLNDCAFDMVFLKMTSLPTAEELETVKLIRFGEKKNTHLLFVFIIPENFKGHRADITLTEPLTTEKMSLVVKYWKTYFSNTVKNENSVKPEELGLPLQKSCSEHLGYFSTDLFACSESLRNDFGLELKAPLSDFEKSKKISLLHSSKEKLRRERIKYCCEQLRTLLPYIKGRKNDAASILEATVDYVKYIREKISPDIMGQNLNDTRAIELSNVHIVFFQKCEKENSVLTSTYSPVRGIRFLANKCLNVYSVPASGGSLDEAVRGELCLTPCAVVVRLGLRGCPAHPLGSYAFPAIPGRGAELEDYTTSPSGQSSSTSENAVGDMYKARIPSTALSLNSFHAVRYYSKVIPSYDAAAVTNQNISVHFPSAVPKVSTFLPQHCNSVLGQSCTTHPNCLNALLQNNEH